MLSIQYVYERVLLISFPLIKLSSSKRLQKYNFFLIPQAFLKKNSFFFLSPTNQNFNPYFASIPRGLGGQRYYLFPLQNKSF